MTAAPGGDSPTPTKPRRLWVVAVVVVAAAAGAWLGGRRQASRATPVTLGNGRPKLLEFGMGLCEQCRRMKPVMARARRELGLRVDVEELDVRSERNAALGRSLGMRVIPTVILVDPAGAVAWRYEGFIPFDRLAAEVDRRLGSSQPAQEHRGE